MNQIETLVDVFARNVAAQTDAVRRGETAAGNKHARRVGQAFQGLCDIGDAGRDALCVLFTHVRPDVRAMAAAFLLRYRTAEALEVLREVARGSGLVSFGASEAMKRWEDGTWALDPALTARRTRESASEQLVRARRSSVLDTEQVRLATVNLGHIDVGALADQLRNAGVSNAEALAGLAVVSSRISTKPTPLATLQLGESRFGGGPDVPPDFVWPTRDGDPLTFLAQFDLSQIRVPSLPEEGWLLFFYDVVRQPWGFLPQDAEGAHVAYVSSPRHVLVRREHPAIEDTACTSESCSISMTPTVNLPHVWDSIIAAAGLEIPRAQWEAYASVAAAVSGVEEDSLHHHLLGHPQLVQDDMRGQCELVANGVSCDGPRAYRGERVQQLLRRGAAEWELLLQIDSDEEGPGWMWGGSGRLYFWIRRSDIASRTFEKTRVILQCG